MPTRAANLFLLLLVIAGLAGAGVSRAVGQEKPNILFIFADDLAHDAVGAAGNEEIHTPNLDELAASGTMFTNAYNMGSWTGAVCVASRTMLNTGLSVWRAQSADLAGVAARRQAWSQLMHDAGYETYMTGKWHVGGLDPNEIFDHAVHIRPGMPNQTPEGYHRPIDGEPDKWSPFDPKFEGFWKGGKHWSEVLADDAVGYLQDAAQRDKPFFMYLAFNAPHDPRQSPEPYVRRYQQQGVSLPASYLPDYPYKADIGCFKLRDEELAVWPRTEHAVRVHLQEYYAIITHMDDQIGRILAALDATGKRENTYIFFSADHGLAVGKHGLLGKQNMYEHSMKPPLFAVGPDIPAGKARDVPVHLQDIVPTSLELAGAEQPESMEFHSLLPRIRNEEAESALDSVYGCYEPGLQRMIRAGDWKLIVYPRAKVVRLFNLAEDPEEIADLAGDEDQRDRIAAMLELLRQKQLELGDQLQLESYFPELAAR